MTYRKKPPKRLTCRACESPLPHGQRDPANGRLYRSDIEYCPRGFGPTPDQGCKDPYHNAVDPSRLPDRRLDESLTNPSGRSSTTLGDILTTDHASRKHPDGTGKHVSQHVTMPGQRPTVSERVGGFIGRIGHLLQRDRSDQYAITQAIQSGDDGLVEGTIAVVAAEERRKAVREQTAQDAEDERHRAEVLTDHARRMEEARLLHDEVASYTMPPTGPAPTGQVCPNCQQIDYDHLPGCAVASGEDVTATTDGALAPTA